MDVLSILGSIDLDAFKVWTWVISILVGGVWWAFSPHKKYWEIISSTVMALLVATGVFMLTSLGVASYVMSHLTDQRWSVGKEQLWTPDRFDSNTPIIGPMLETLNDAQENVSGAVNTIGALQNGLGVAAEFFMMAVYAVPVAIVLALAARWSAKWSAKRSIRERDRIKAEEDAARDQQIQANKEENERIRRHMDQLRKFVGMPEFTD